MKTRNILTLIALGGLALACSSSAADKFGSSDQFCTAKAEAECNNLAKPCGASVDACKSKRAASCNTAAAAAAGQGRSYRPNAAQDCIDKVNSVYANSAGNVTPDGDASVVTVCERVFGGSKAERDPCANTFECSGALICDSVCAVQETVGLNGGCANAGQVCDKGLYCQASGGTGKRFCVAKNKLNDSCGATNPCSEAFRCLTGSCVDRVTVGNPCDADSDCAAEAPFCDLTTTPKKCRPKYQAGTSACKEYGSNI
jgi:hypothetical protein